MARLFLPIFPCFMKVLGLLGGLSILLILLFRFPTWDVVSKYPLAEFLAGSRGRNELQKIVRTLRGSESLQKFRAQVEQLQHELSNSIAVDKMSKNTSLESSNVTEEGIKDLSVEGEIEESSIQASVDERPRVPISLLIPCAMKHQAFFPRIFESLIKQTVLPDETIFALSVPEQADSNFDWELFSKIDVPNLRLHLRGGTHFAGDQRSFLADLAKNDIVSFFDCDDYMHPQRIEFLHKAFVTSPGLEAVLHGFVFFKGANWGLEGSKRNSFLQLYDSSQISFEPTWPFEYLWERPAIAKGPTEKSHWVIDPEYGEPNHGPSIKEHWFFPLDMNLKPPLTVSPHNGWLTIKKSTAKEVEYPNVRRGQDSLFNYRLLKQHKNFTVLPVKLGAYIFGRS